MRKTLTYHLLTKVLPIILLLMVNFKVMLAQSKVDTLEFAKKLQNEKKFKEAFKLLQTYQIKHVNDLNAMWLSAQTAYWMKKYNKSKEIYNKAIRLNPNNNYLKLDYAKMLFSLNDYDNTKLLLNDYLKHDSLNAEALVMLAKMSYWNGDYKTAKSYLAKVYYSDPNNASALSLIYEINSIYYVTDTVETAKAFRDKHKFKEAFDLLIRFSDAHPTNLDAAWLCAQTAYWLNNIDAAERVYERAIRYHDDNYNLKFDYATILVSQGEFIKARPLLESYLTFNKDNPQALMYLAKSALWSGNYDEAIGYLDTILKNDPKNKGAKDLLNEITAAKAPWIKISSVYSKDDQPMKKFNDAIEGGLYFNALFALDVTLQRLDFNTVDGNANANWVHIGNKSQFAKAGLDVNLEAGLITYPNNNGTAFTGDIKLTKYIVKHLYLVADAERLPYLYTKSSLTTPTIENNLTASLVLDDSKSWNGKIIYKINQFNDNNTVTTLAAWLIAPPFKFSKFEFSIGYGFNYSNAKENRFTTDQPSAEVIANYYTYENIAGYYNPYFTPNSFMSNVVIASGIFHATKKLDFGVSCSYGFYSTTQNPYFYLNYDAKHTIYVAKGYEEETFSPVDLKVYTQYQLSKKANLRLEYNYNKTIFYSVNYVGLGLQMSFYNEKK